MLNIRQNYGLTLLEMLIVISIVAILAAIAVPSMQDTLRRNAVRGLQTDLVSAFNYARSEAVSRNKFVSVCASRNSATCTGQNDWGVGWLIFVDDGAGSGTNGNGELEGDEVLLRAYESTSSATVRLANSADAAMASISWNFRGFASNRHQTDAASGIEQGAAAVICGPDATDSVARAVIVARTGRVYRSVDSDGDGVHEKSFNTDASNGTGLNTGELSCS